MSQGRQSLETVWRLIKSCEPFWIMKGYQIEDKLHRSADPEATARDWLIQIYGEVVMYLACQHVGVKEKGNNRGPEVESFLQRVGGQAGYAWCAAFAYTCHDDAAKLLGGLTSTPRTFKAVHMWLSSNDFRFTKKEALSESCVPRAGDIFVMADQKFHGHFRKNSTEQMFVGHTGLVQNYAGGILRTVEGNTDLSGSRTGHGVYERDDRMKSSYLYGFVRPRLILS